MNEIDARSRLRVPARAARDAVVQIRALITHPMENGTRTGPDGRVVPRHIIHRFLCTFNDQKVLDIDIGPSFSANPYLEFDARVPATGRFYFEWHDDNGAVYRDSASIEVS
ncbi:thiosulfate oxidation carrier complex protein SoxZ [Pararhodobacter sp.]|uniref:thiosulfate oxidation carrier complex protein SoxZ n=1 Tax=Pararhodobacter sp. TaxID=2127056 RepID=UPI002FDD8458